MADLTDTDRSALAKSQVIAPAFALAIGSGAVIWFTWFLLHLPALSTPPTVAGPVIGLVWIGASAFLARRWGVGPARAALSGLLAAMVSLLLLGSMLARPSGDHFADGAGGLRPGALLIAGGFLAGGALVGAIGGLAGRGNPVRPPVDLAWHSRLAGAVAATFAPLLLIGGFVTSTESGMAVPDWPSTFGSNMFLYPQELMQQQSRVYLEHMHRLFGSLAGLCTMILWIATLAHAPARRRFGLWTTLLFLAVCLQGYIGAQRVLLNNPYLGALHGTFGQVTFAFAGVIALWMSPIYASLAEITLAGTRRVRLFATMALHATILQLVLGSVYRHLRRGEDAGATHIAWTHIAFAFVVVLLAIVSGSLLIRAGKTGREALGVPVATRLRRIGAGIHGVVGLQFALGWAAFIVVMTGDPRAAVPTTEALAAAEPVPAAEAIASTLHQGNGALLLLLLMLGWAWSRRLHRAAAGI